MKKIIKNLKLVSYICLAMFLLNSCTQEKEFINEHNHPNIDFKEKSFKEALSLPLFNDALQKVSKQKGALRSEDAARTALEDQYGFTIVTDAPIRIITDQNGTVSYTILIEREVKEELKFENLMIKVENEETTAAIFKYLMERKGTISEAGEYFFPNVESSEFTDLNVAGKVFYNSDTGEACVTTTQVMCNATWEGEPYNHIANLGCYQYAAGHNYSNLYESSSTVCFGSGGGGGTGGGTGSGGGSTGGSSNNTGGLGGSGGNNQPIDVTPIPCRTGNCMEDTRDPCDLINQVNTKFPLLKPALVSLKGTTSQTNENGIFIDNTATSTTVNPIQNIPAGIGGKININTSPPNPYVVIAHTHDALGNGQTTYSVFSMEDLALLANLANNNQIDGEILFYLATADGTQYLLTIDNIEKLKDFFGNTSNTAVGGSFDSAKFIKNSEIQNKYFYPVIGKIQPNSSSNENDLIAFLEFLKEAKLGVSMYEVDSTFTTYTKVVLKKVAGINTVDRKPCIN